MMGNEGSAIDFIRETSRELLFIRRLQERLDIADNSRSVRSDENDDIREIANKLKTKAPVTLDELQCLKNAFLDDDCTINIFLNTSGALKGLVRELSSKDASKQVAAAGSLCNIALGNKKAGVSLAKAAAHYLIPGLDNQNNEFAVTCAWALGNIAASGDRACNILASQGVITKLIKLMNSKNQEIKEAAIYAVLRYSHQMKDKLKKDQLRDIFNALPNYEVPETEHLLFILSCHGGFSKEFISEAYLLQLLQYMEQKIIMGDELPMNVVRLLANINDKEIYDVVLSYICNKSLLMFEFKIMSDNDEVMWFLGNASNLNKDHPFFEMYLKMD